MKSKSGYGALIAAEVAAAVDEAPARPRVPHVHNRQTAISKLGGDVVYDQNLLVSPEACRPSRENARQYSDLTYENCEELIASIKSEQRQRIAATVRESGDPEVPYEIVAGLRRHFAISWLRANNYPDLRYLVNVQSMDDETAFRLSDLENRPRSDISDFERGRSYADALTRHYGDSYERMAERIGLSSSTLRRYVQLGRLDSVFIEAIGGIKAVRVAHASTLTTEINKPGANRVLFLDQASQVVDMQNGRRTAGEGLIEPSQVIKLITAEAKKRPSRKSRKLEIRSAAGKPMFEYTRGTAKIAGTVRLLPKSGATLDEMKAEILTIVERAFVDLQRQ